MKLKHAWICGLLLFATAITLWLGTDHVLGRETGAPPQNQAKSIPSSPAAAPEDPDSRPPWGIRALLVILGLAVWHGTQRLLGDRPAAPAEQVEQAAHFLTQQDGLLRLSEPVNRFLNAHPRSANAILLVSSALIDGLGIFLFVWSIAGSSIRPFLGLCILFALRQLCQVLTALPPPVGSIWRHPGFPSLFVTYGVSNDLFFSGHTALAVYGAVEVAHLGYDWLTWVAIAIVIFETAVVLLLRAHYTMDVFAGFMTALFVAGIAASLAVPCDRTLAHAFAGASAASSLAEPRL